MRTVVYIGVFVGVLLVLLLSWLPSPDIGDVLPFPTGLKKWINDNMNLRTAVPFIFLGIFAAIIISSLPQRMIACFWALLLLLAVVILAETGQLLLPKRHFDWGDIGYGLLGSITGMLVGFFSFQLIQWVTKNRIRNDKRSNEINSNTGNSLL